MLSLKRFILLFEENGRNGQCVRKCICIYTQIICIYTHISVNIYVHAHIYTHAHAASITRPPNTLLHKTLPSINPGRYRSSVQTQTGGGDAASRVFRTRESTSRLCCSLRTHLGSRAFAGSAKGGGTRRNTFRFRSAGESFALRTSLRYKYSSVNGPSGWTLASVPSVRSRQSAIAGF
jgi:hypothetical protein